MFETSSALQPVKSDDSPAAASGSGFTLVAGATYYVALGAGGVPHMPLQSIHMLFDAASIITSVEIEDSNFPEASLTSTNAGEWIKENPPGVYIATVGNCTATLLVVAKTAGAIGAALVHAGNFGSSRARLKIVVGAVGGVARFSACGKGA